jgi:hypothetical protein
MQNNNRSSNYSSMVSNNGHNTYMKVKFNILLFLLIVSRLITYLYWQSVQFSRMSFPLVQVPCSHLLQIDILIYVIDIFV